MTTTEISSILEKKEREKSLLLAFSNHLATVRDMNGVRVIIQQFLKQIFSVTEYLITLRNDDNKTYSYFMHDLPVPDPTDEGFKIITGDKMPIAGAMTGAVLQSEEPVTFSIQDNIRTNRYSFPSLSFWRAAGASQIMGIRLRVAQEDIGILWLQPGKVNDRLLKGISAQIAIALANATANRAIERQLQEIRRYKQQLENENRYLQSEIRDTHNSDEIVGRGIEMQKVFRLVERVAFASSTVLILGETGTGKELIARAIHQHSPRKDKLMVKVNCAALPEHLIESELFGHERGSFTGAIDRKIGKFELANDSTLFLDEIGEMPMDLQVKLLRAIQEREIERVGGKGTIKINVRIIAATNRPLHLEVMEGRFRSDLYYRLNVFPICMPALRERIEDIPLLVEHFIKKLSRSTGRRVMDIAPEALRELMTYSWPGNIRELENLIERSLLLTKGDVINKIFLPASSIKTEAVVNTASVHGSDALLKKTLDENERDYIVAVLRQCKGKISGPGGAAAILGVPSSTLNSKMRKLGIRKERAYGN